MEVKAIDAGDPNVGFVDADRMMAVPSSCMAGPTTSTRRKR